ncbi:hypothetical protein E2C01_064047 [Portunus trituberculatus]|uniref:Uncharacterized protein n=1 Tax=Portunus trituberculatus TaxID=210409 RepID=A0A5B7HIQ0_PORTR|nr:hypothetical protein [Portunus trituberculatus]
MRVSGAQDPNGFQGCGVPPFCPQPPPIHHMTLCSPATRRSDGKAAGSQVWQHGYQKVSYQLLVTNRKELFTALIGWHTAKVLQVRETEL